MKWKCRESATNESYFPTLIRFIESWGASSWWLPNIVEHRPTFWNIPTLWEQLWKPEKSESTLHLGTTPGRTTFLAGEVGEAFGSSASEADPWHHRCREGKCGCSCTDPEPGSLIPAQRFYVLANICCYILFRSLDIVLFATKSPVQYTH